MQYVISYDIVGLFVLALLFILNFSITKSPSRTTFCYKLFIIVSFLSAFLDVFTIWTNHYTHTPLGLFLNYVLAVIHISAVGGVIFVYYLFILTIVSEQRELSKPGLIFGFVVYGIDFIAIATSPFTHFILYYDEAGTYLHGPGFVGTYIIIIIFLIAAVIVLFRNKKKITKRQFYIVLSYSLIDVIAAVYQFNTPGVLLIGFASGVSLMVISFALKNPIELVDQNVGVYNRTAFKEFLFTNHNRGSMVILYLNNASAIKYMYGLDNGYSIIRKCIAILFKECNQKYAFYIFSNTIVLVCKNENIAKKTIEVIKKYNTIPIEVASDTDKNLKYQVQLESEMFLIKDPQLLQNAMDTNSKKNSLDQIIDILQFLLESIKDKNELTVIDEQFVEYYKERLRIQKVVDEAIKEERFEVFLQPIFDLKEKRYTGAESLIRLRDSEGKMISPGLFIPEAEKNGKILALGDISIKKTCEFIRDGKLAELGIQKVNINLSMVQCMQDNIVEHLIELLESYDIPKTMIRFEITETMTSTSPDKLRDVMTRLSSYGIEFALDDYGTGYSNTSRLLSFPFSEIKFDKSFVDSAMENTRNTLPLKHLMNMVSDSDMIVLVEGVETKEMSDLIEKFGGNLIQGFFYAKPLPLNEFVIFIKNNK